MQEAFLQVGRRKLRRAGIFRQELRGGDKGTVYGELHRLTGAQADLLYR